MRHESAAPPLARPASLVQTAHMSRHLRILPLILVLGLTACGFHLRDALLLPADLGPLQVTARDQYSALVLDLQ